MKINLEQPSGQTPDLKKKPKAPQMRRQKEKAPAPEKGIYKKALMEYAEKAKSGNGGILRKNKFWIVVCIILFVVFISVNSRTSREKMQLSVRLSDLTKETSSLIGATDEVKADLEEQARVESVQMEKEEEEKAKNNATEQGVLVAKLQNDYQEIQPPAATEDVEQSKEATTAYIQAMNKKKDELGVFFGPDDQNARTPWYSYVDPVGIPGTWEFASKAPFRGTKAQVLWLCKSEDGMLLSYCIASYDAETKLFTKVDWKLTQYAQVNMGTDEEIPEGSDVGSVTEIPDDVISPSDVEAAEQDMETTEGLSDTRTSWKEKVANGEIEGEEYDENNNIGL